MVDSPHHPEEEVIFALGEAGVIDPEDAEKKTKKTTKKIATKKVITKKAKDTPEVEATVETTPDTPEVEATVETTPDTPEVEATVETMMNIESDDSEPLEE
jgi:DNA repair protein RadA